MSVSINGTGGITFADASTQNTGGYTGFRNRIINGAMMIDQRNNGSAITINSYFQFPVDRFYSWQFTGSTFSTMQRRSGDGPAGFYNYMRVATTSTYSSFVAGGWYAIRHGIEGYNISDLGWGFTGAASVTLSFWVRVSVAGTYVAAIRSIGASLAYAVECSIPVANTWTYITKTIPGPTTGGLTAFPIDNSGSIDLVFILGSNQTNTANTWSATTAAGTSNQTNMFATNGSTFDITGVQLEKGSVATPFEFRPYGTELALCQRYYQPIYGFIRGASSSAIGSTGFTKVAMRAAPTLAGTASQGTSLVLGAGTADTTGSWYVQATSAVNGIVEYSGTASADL